MIPNPAFGFSAEFQEDDPAYDQFDDYLREEFGEREPGWEARFGKASLFDQRQDRYNHAYLINGNVPDATSHEDAEQRVQELIEQITRGLRTLPSRVERAIPRARIHVWRRS